MIRYKSFTDLMMIVFLLSEFAVVHDPQPDDPVSIGIFLDLFLMLFFTFDLVLSGLHHGFCLRFLPVR